MEGPCNLCGITCNLCGDDINAPAEYGTRPVEFPLSDEQGLYRPGDDVFYRPAHDPLRRGPDAKGTKKLREASPVSFAVVAPPGKLGLVFAEVTKCESYHHVVVSVRKESPLKGRVLPGDVVVWVDDGTGNHCIGKGDHATVTRLLQQSHEKTRTLTLIRGAFVRQNELWEPIADRKLCHSL